jgi:type II secretory pathway component GspD/PulD (secretin)
MRPTEAIFDEGKHIKDAKDVKHCIQCGLTAVSKKGDLIKCDTCHQFWHIDCLPNPTTAPPQTWSAMEKRGNRMTDVFKKRYWECPRHVDQDMITLTDPNFYAGDINNKRGVKVRLPKKQLNQIAAIKAGLPQPLASQVKKVRDTPDEVMHVNIEVDDSWWEKYDARKNELKETDNTAFLLHENNVLADFAAKARKYVSQIPELQNLCC